MYILNILHRKLVANQLKLPCVFKLCFRDTSNEI